MNPSTAELVEAVDAVRVRRGGHPAQQRQHPPVAERVDDLTDKPVWVVPTDTIAEGFAALLAYDPEADGDGNAQAMEALGPQVVAGEVTRAVRDSDSRVGPIADGDWLGLSAHGHRGGGRPLAEAACSLLDALVHDDHDLSPSSRARARAPPTPGGSPSGSASTGPSVETEVHHGGQPLYPYLFSIE